MTNAPIATPSRPRVAEISGRRGSGFDVDRLYERAVQLVPHLNCVYSRGHVRECERAGRIGDRKVWMGDDTYVAKHPWVHVRT